MVSATLGADPSVVGSQALAREACHCGGGDDVVALRLRRLAAFSAAAGVSKRPQSSDASSRRATGCSDVPSQGDAEVSE